MSSQPAPPAPLGRSVVLYACAFAVAGATPFLLLPLLTRQLSPQQFGEVTSFLILAALLGSLAGLSAHGFIAVRFFKTAAEPMARLVSSSLAAVAAAHLLSFVVVVLLLPVLARIFDLPARYSVLAVPAAFVVNLNLAWLSLFQSSGQPMRYLQMRLVQGAAEIGLCLVLLHFAGADAGARIDSYVVATSLGALVGAAWCWRQGRIGTRIEREHWRGLLTFGLPLLPHIVAGSAITYLDRLVVSSLLGIEKLGIYMAAMQLGLAMSALVEPLNKALAPWMLERLNRNDPGLRRQIVLRTYQLQAGLVLLGLVVGTAAWFLFDSLIGTRFAAAKPLVPWMVAGFVLQGMYYTVVIYLFFAERTGRLSIVSCTVAAIGIAVSYTLTQQFGLTGAGISFVINNALMLVLVWWVAAKAVPMPWLRSF